MSSEARVERDRVEWARGERGRGEQRLLSSPNIHHPSANHRPAPRPTSVVCKLKKDRAEGAPKATRESGGRDEKTVKETQNDYEVVVA
ncbi:unnamed protein product [Bursaphelenchus okinawaensis]|uniref:Uncharacterized protein n=1 Tax=Bursaphelenchus okinawaensis TaxID=465554 RepID=A0A811KA88_9BILA|nr:unnamed protein product [Bursaphelenchus okinawaensis]CAG9095864.1 unnamed protein product [Bursaphelenchus okinawaensis]